MIIIELIIVVSLFLIKLLIDSKLKKLRSISLNNVNNVYIDYGYFQDKPIYNALVTLTINPKIVISNALLEKLGNEELTGVITHEEGHVLLGHVSLGILFIIASVTMFPNFIIFLANHAMNGIIGGVLALYFTIIQIFLLRKVLLSAIEAEADWHAFKKNEDLYFKTLSALDRLDLLRKSGLSKLLDAHGTLEHRLEAQNLNPESNSNFLMIMLPFATFSVMSLMARLLRNTFPPIDSHPLIALIFFTLLFSGIVGVLIFSLILYCIFKYAGFSFPLARLSVISYVTIAAIPFSFPLGGYYDQVIANVSAIALSVYLLCKEGLVKAIILWIIVFLIHVAASLTWILLPPRF